jgi:hypothetical protein
MSLSLFILLFSSCFAFKARAEETRNYVLNNDGIEEDRNGDKKIDLKTILNEKFITKPNGKTQNSQTDLTEKNLFYFCLKEKLE